MRLPEVLHSDSKSHQYRNVDVGPSGGGLGSGQNFKPSCYTLNHHRPFKEPVLEPFNGTVRRTPLEGHSRSHGPQEEAGKAEELQVPLLLDLYTVGTVGALIIRIGFL